MTSIVTKNLCFLFTNTIKFKFPIQISSQSNFTKLFSTNVNHQESLNEQLQQQKNQQLNEIELNTKILKIAVIGVPNAGKSTFINNLINHRVCPISNKVHTTRNTNRAIYTINNTQLIFYDTPGLVTEREIKKHHLESSFCSAYKHSIQHGNMICVIHDISNTWQRHQLHPTVLNTLKLYSNYPSFLILNKIDCLKSKRILLDLVRNLTNNTLSSIGKNKKKFRKNENNDSKVENDNDEKKKKEVGWSNFSDVFMVSSITSDGLQDVMQYLIKNAQLGNWEFPADIYTDQKPEMLIQESVRARLLDYLPQEIPYTLKSEIEYYNVNKGIIYASVLVTCPNSRIEKLVCGEMNGKLKQITERVTSDLVETFEKAVSLTITTCVTKHATEIK